MKLPLCILVLSLLPVTEVAAKHWHENPKHANKHSGPHDWDDDERAHARHEEGCYLHPGDVRIIREYYEPRYRSLPPGLAKKYRRTGHLPPGWQKKMEPIPVVVEHRLEPLPRPYRRGYIDGSIVVYSPDTQVIIDVVALRP